MREVAPQKHQPFFEAVDRRVAATGAQSRNASGLIILGLRFAQRLAELYRAQGKNGGEHLQAIVAISENARNPDQPVSAMPNNRRSLHGAVSMPPPTAVNEPCYQRGAPEPCTRRSHDLNGLAELYRSRQIRGS